MPALRVFILMIPKYKCIVKQIPRKISGDFVKNTPWKVGDFVINTG